MEEKKEQEPIKLLNLVIRYKNAFMQLWVIVIILGLLMGAYSLRNAKNSYRPQYRAKAIFTVDVGYTSDDIMGSSTYYDQYAAQQLAAAFPRIVSTNMLKDLVAQELPKGYITGHASASAVADSNMLVLTVTDGNPQDAYDYLCAIIDCFPQVMVYMMNNIKVKIVTAPTVPVEPINPYEGNKSAVKGAAVGIAAGLLIIFVCALMTRTIQTTDELKDSVNIPILVALPKVSKKKRRSGKNSLILAESDPNMVESFRGLRVKVKKLLDTPEKKSILVTSTLAGEGKTTTAANLAMSLVRDGHKVVLLDADLRSQSVARSLGEKPTGTGLMDCLKDPDLNIMACIRTSKTYELDFISGRSTDKRHYTIDPSLFRQILAELAANYDYIVIDTPPCEVVSETTTLCRCADCVLYVVKQDFVKRSRIINAISALDQKDVSITGLIFNGVPRFHRQYGYGYRSTYGYGYDYAYHKYGYNSKYGYGYGYGYGYYSYKKAEKDAAKAAKKNKKES